MQASQPHHAVKNQKQGPQARILDTSSSTESKQRMTVGQMKASGGHMQGANQQMIGQNPQSTAVKKVGYSRNQPNLGAGAGTAGPLLQGPQKQQMNFTSYESGFGVGSRGNSAIGQGGPQQPNVNLVGKANRLFPNQFDQAANMRGAGGGQGGNSTLLKQQQVNPMAASTIYGNMSNQAPM